MKYPEELNKGDTIGITAPSCGIREKDILRYKNSIKKIQEKGYKIIETDDVIREEPRSINAKQRAKEFVSLWENPNLKTIICPSSGDFLCEVLDELDFNNLKTQTPKWFQGYSDITALGYTITTNLDIATIYGPNGKTYGMNNWHESLEETFKLMEKQEFTMNSYDLCESTEEWHQDETDPYRGYNLQEKVKWINLSGEEKTELKGRAIGGCFDVITNLIGTKYDNTKNFIQKYKQDGTIWFFDVFEKSTPLLFTNLWQMKNAGYFENCKGIIFGRPLIIKEEYQMSFEEAIKESLNDLNLPIIINADIGHLAPQIPIINGGIIEVTSQEGKGTIKNMFE